MQRECVGTLLVPERDMKELSESLHQEEKDDNSFVLPDVNLKRRVSAGTLLVRSADLESPVDDRMGKPSNLRKRLTEVYENATDPKNNNDKSECVGSLLVHGSDVQEMSDSLQKEKNECVGSLIVHQSDVQELSSVPNVLPDVNLKRRVSAGTLLVNSSDLETPIQKKGSSKKPIEFYGSAPHVPPYY